jgi:Raf kinase inhibitor-like YbhB/YbcL family protein
MNSNKFVLYSDAFTHTNFIPEKYTGDGENINPPLKWENPPLNTKSYALIVDDPDAPHGTFTHWLVKDIHKDQSEIKENSCQGNEISSSWKVKKWKGPQPPSGTHRYFFKLYALNEEKMKAENLIDFYEEVQQHKLGEAQLMGKYSAN